MPDIAERRLLEDIKVDVLSHGVRLTPDGADWLARANDGPLTVHEYPTTGGLTFELPRKVYVNAPFDEWYCASATTEFTVRDGEPLLHHPAGEVPVLRLLPLPGYLDATDDQGRPVTDVAMSHVDRVRISPLRGCAFDCSYCDLPFEAYQLRDGQQMAAALAIAAGDEALPVRHMLISGGSPKRRDYERFEHECGLLIDAAVSLGLPVDVMMAPPIDGTDLLDRLVARGVTGFSINIKLFSEGAGLTYLGRKYRVTRPHAEALIGRAVELLGRDGQVRSLIIPGLESVEDTLDGVRWLARLGCWPVLSPFRPAAGTGASTIAPPSGEDLRTLLDASREIVAAAGVALGPVCAQCQHNTLTFPWDIPAHLRED